MPYTRCQCFKYFKNTLDRDRAAAYHNTFLLALHLVHQGQTFLVIKTLQRISADQRHTKSTPNNNLVPIFSTLREYITKLNAHNIVIMDMAPHCKPG